MKRAAFLLIIVFCVAAVLPLKWAAAGTDIYFTVVNDRPLDLNDETMPVKIGDVYYVPISVFSQYTLSTYATYDREKRTAAIYSDDRSISFELGSGNTYDNRGRSYGFQAIYYNSGVYVPAINVCQFFGFKFSAYSNSIAMFLRIRSSASVISDDDFARLSALKMQSMLNQYLSSRSSPASPSVPSLSPYFPSPSVPESSPAVSKYAYVHLSVRGIGGDTERMLDLLSYYDYSACFFVTADEIQKNPDLIRRIAGSGHSIGIICSGDLSYDYGKASSLLRDAAMVKSIIVSLDCKLTPELETAAKNRGLIIWNDSEMNVMGYNYFADSGAIGRLLENAEGRLDLSFSDGSLTLFREALRLIYLNDYAVKTICETTNTYLNRNMG